MSSIVLLACIELGLSKHLLGDFGLMWLFRHVLVEWVHIGHSACVTVASNDSEAPRPSWVGVPWQMTPQG